MKTPEHFFSRKGRESAVIYTRGEQTPSELLDVQAELQPYAQQIKDWYEEVWEKDNTSVTIMLTIASQISTLLPAEWKQMQHKEDIYTKGFISLIPFVEPSSNTFQKLLPNDQTLNRAALMLQLFPEYRKDILNHIQEHIQAYAALPQAKAWLGELVGDKELFFKHLSNVENAYMIFPELKSEFQHSFVKHLINDSRELEFYEACQLATITSKENAQRYFHNFKRFEGQLQDAIARKRWDRVLNAASPLAVFQAEEIRIDASGLHLLPSNSKKQKGKAPLPQRSIV